MTLPLSGVSPAVAADAYRRIDGPLPDPASGGFGAALERAIGGVVDAGHAADEQAMRGVLGKANVTDVVTAVSKAELALQTTAALRDRVVQAYQDIMRMPI